MSTWVYAAIGVVVGLITGAAVAWSWVGWVRRPTVVDAFVVGGVAVVAGMAWPGVLFAGAVTMLGCGLTYAVQAVTEWCRRGWGK